MLSDLQRACPTCLVTANRYAAGLEDDLAYVHSEIQRTRPSVASDCY